MEQRFAIGGKKMSEIQIRELDPAEYKLWDELVETSSCGTVFHTSDWLTLCRDTFSKDLKIYGCFQEDALVGGFPLFIRKMNRIFKVASSTCEMTPYGGIVIKDFPGVSVRKQVQDSHEILNHLRVFLSNMKLDSIEMKLSPDFKDIRPFTWNGWESGVFYAYYLNLERDIDAGLSKDLKKNINKSAKEGLVVKKLKDSNVYYNLFSMVYTRQNLTSPVQKIFFDRVIDLLERKGIGEMWVAETPSAEYVAAQIRVWDKQRVYAWTASSDPSYRKSGANSLIYYNVISDLKAEGHKEINMLAANHSQFTDFITGFNPELVPHYLINYTSRRYKLLRACRGLLKR